MGTFSLSLRNDRLLRSWWTTFSAAWNVATVPCLDLFDFLLTRTTRRSMRSMKTGFYPSRSQNRTSTAAGIRRLPFPFTSLFVSSQTDFWVVGETMSTKTKKRVLADYKYYQRNPPSGITCRIHDDNMLIWDACILGYALCASKMKVRPEDTPWEGGTFFLRIEISEQYPETAPTIRFVNYLFHPNSDRLS